MQPADQQLKSDAPRPGVALARGAVGATPRRDQALPILKSSVRAERSMETRARILAAAASTFVALGYSATSVEEVATRAGVTKVTIYYHFKNKESLYAAVAAETARTYTDTVRLLTLSDAEPAQKLSDLICRLIDAVTEPETKRLHYERYVPLSEETRAILRDAQRYYAGAICDQIRECQARGEVYEGDPRLMALAVFEGAGRIAVWYSPEGPVPPSEAHGILCETFLRGLLTPAAMHSVAQFRGRERQHRADWYGG